MQETPPQRAALLPFYFFTFLLLCHSRIIPDEPFSTLSFSRSTFLRPKSKLYDRLT